MIAESFKKKLTAAALHLSGMLFLCVLIAISSTLPASARFLSPDTYDPWLQSVDINRYAYSGNDPINGSDPNGHAGIGHNGGPDLTLPLEPDKSFDEPENGYEVQERHFDQQMEHRFRMLGTLLDGLAGTVLIHNTQVANAKKPPNPYGKLGDPVTQERVKQIVSEIRARGNFAKTEYGIKIVNGFKLRRYVDVAEIDPATKEVIAHHQVGLTTKSGLPVSRERKAISDIEKTTGKKVLFHDKYQNDSSKSESDSSRDQTGHTSCNWSNC